MVDRKMTWGREKGQMRAKGGGRGRDDLGVTVVTVTVYASPIPRARGVGTNGGSPARMPYRERCSKYVRRYQANIYSILAVLFLRLAFTMSVVTNNFLRFQPLLLDDDSDDDDMRSTVSSLFSSPSDDMSSGTSYTTDSNRSDSPAPSVLSMTSSMEAATFKIEYGRGINSASDVYSLPADDEELDRLGESLSCFGRR